MPHAWVQLTMTSVEVLVGTNGEPVVFVDDECHELLSGCEVCDAALDDAWMTDCAGGI